MEWVIVFSLHIYISSLLIPRRRTRTKHGHEGSWTDQVQLSSSASSHGSAFCDAGVCLLLTGIGIRNLTGSITFVGRIVEARIASTTSCNVLPTDTPSLLLGTCIPVYRIKKVLYCCIAPGIFHGHSVYFSEILFNPISHFFISRHKMNLTHTCIRLLATT